MVAASPMVNNRDTTTATMSTSTAAAISPTTKSADTLDHIHSPTIFSVLASKNESSGGTNTILNPTTHSVASNTAFTHTFDSHQHTHDSLHTLTVTLSSPM